MWYVKVKTQVDSCSAVCEGANSGGCMCRQTDSGKSVQVEV